MRKKKRSQVLLRFFRKLSYKLDRTIHKPLWIQLFLLFLLSLVITLVGAIGAAIVSSERFPSLLWWALLHITDPGYLGNDSGSGLRLIGLMVVLAGLVVFGVLISILNNDLQERLDSIRKGRRPVLEANHTVILGWSGEVFTLIDELVEGGSDTIVVLANRDVEEMEREIAWRCPQSARRVICRSGDVSSLSDLAMIGVSHAREIVILGEKVEKSEAVKVEVLKGLLGTALHLENEHSEKDRVLCLPLWNGITMDAFLILEEKIPRFRIHVFNARELISRLIAQISLMPVWEKVYTELMSYEGSEFYICDLSPKWAGKTFRELLLSRVDVIPVGIITGNEQILCPPADFHLEAGQKIVVLAQNDKDVVTFRNSSPRGQVEMFSHDLTPKKNIFVSPISTHRIVAIAGEGYYVDQLAAYIRPYLPRGSKVYYTSHHADRQDGEDEGGIQVVPIYVEDENMDSWIEFLGQVRDIDTLVISSGKLDPDHHDMSVLMKVVYANWFQKKENLQFRIITELLDPRNVDFARVLGVDMVVVSTSFVSRYIAQVLKTPWRGRIFEELLGPEGRELGVIPGRWYRESTSEGLTFQEIIQTTYMRTGAIPIGVIVNGDMHRPLVQLNPPRSAYYSVDQLIKVIVLGEWTGS